MSRDAFFAKEDDVRARVTGRARWTPILPQSDTSLVTPPSDSARALRRSMLVSGLFKCVKEVQRIDAGYALRFLRSDNLDDLEELLGPIANYIVFESRNSPQLTFAIVEEPRTKSFWLQIRNVGDEKHDVESASVPSDSSGFFLA
jgi:hypothetical protein